MASRIELGSVPAEACCINCRVIIEYVQRRAPERALELYSSLPEPYSNLASPDRFLTDENNWVPSSVVVRLFENAKRILDDPNAPFKMGFESVTEKKLGYIQRFFISTFISVAGALRRVEQINARFNTTKTSKLVHRSPGRAVVHLHWNPNGELSKDICEFNKGIYSAIPTMWGLRAATIEEPRCRFDGDELCQFNCSWDVKAHLARGIVESLTIRKSHLVDALEEIEKDKELLKSKYDEVNQLNLELEDKIIKLQAINDASRILVSNRETTDFLDMTMGILVRILHFDRAILMIVNKQEQVLEYLYSTGSDDLETARQLQGYRISLSRDHNLMVRVAKSGEPVLVKDVAKEGLNPENVILNQFKPLSFCLAPLTTVDDEVIGVLGADRKTYQKPITETDLDYLTIFANNIAVSFQRARLDEELKMSYLNSVRSLVNALEEKDPYTKGHSERVASIAALVGQEMGLSEEEVEYLRIGGYVHDIGKIGVPESIINCASNLDDDQYRQIQLHTIKGVEILEPISFLKDHLHLIRHHHEHWNGEGYPDGLKAECIPLGAQIMAVADTYDAMTSDRSYRAGRAPKEALGEIEKLSGKQFAPDVVATFHRVFEKLIVHEPNKGSTRNSPK